MNEPKATPTRLIENRSVIVTRWTFASGEATGPHVHAHDYVVVPLTTGKLRIVTPDGAARDSRRTLLAIPDSAVAGIRGVTEPLAEVLARGTRKRFATTWSVAEVGAAGPTGNRYGDPSGHSCIAIAGPVERAITVETGSN